jgi:hypothetical protein
MDGCIPDYPPPRAGFIAISTWVIASGCMWMLEKDNEEVQPNFDSVPRSMYYTLLMMFGEFPITDFTTPGKVCSWRSEAVQF